MEEILNGKLHFLCSAVKLVFRKSFNVSKCLLLVSLRKVPLDLNDDLQQQQKKSTLI